MGLEKNWAAGFRFAYYQADELMTDTPRAAVYTPMRSGGAGRTAAPHPDSFRLSVD